MTDKILSLKAIIFVLQITSSVILRAKGYSCLSFNWLKQLKAEISIPVRLVAAPMQQKKTPLTCTNPYWI